MASKFQYAARPQEAWQKRSEQSGSKYASFALDEFKTYTVRKGENLIRILPPTWPNPSHYGMDIFVHYNVGPEQGTVLCLAKMKGQPCPICEAFQKAENLGREDAGELKWTRRVLAWILDRKAEKAEDKVPQLWAMPWTVDRDISKVCRDRQTGELYQIDHPEAGYDVAFDKEGDKQQTKYVGIAIMRRPSSVDDASLEYIIKHPLDTVFLWRNYAEVSALFEGQPPEASAPPVASKQEVVDTKSDFSLQSQEFCPEVMTFRGEMVGCSIIGKGHSGPHDYSREIKSETLSPELCSVTMNFKGELVGCDLQQGHIGDHNFSREMGAAPVSAPTVQTTLPIRETRQPEPVAAQPAATTTPAAQPAVSGRASALRNRFTTGGAK